MRVVTVEDIELVTGLTAAESESVLAEIVPIGLLDAAGPDEPDAYRYHPLVREFLESRLRQEEGHEAVVAQHRRLAAAHEGRDWRTAAYHYDAIQSIDDLQRVLVESAPTIMARGEFDVASQFANGLGHADSDPALNMFTSRVALDRGDVPGALRYAQLAYDATRTSEAGIGELGLANLMAMHFSAGHRDDARAMAEELVDSAAHPRLIAIGAATKAAIDACGTGRLDDYQSTLEYMEQEQRDSRSTHYLGVTLLNLGVIALHRGRAQTAVTRGREAIELLSKGSRRTERDAARLCVAWGLAHLGLWTEAETELRQALGQEPGPPRIETLIESAECFIRYGPLEEAERLTSLALHEVVSSNLTASTFPLVRAELALRLRRPADARTALEAVDETTPSLALGFETRRRYVDARVRLALRSLDHRAAIDSALAFAWECGSVFHAEALILLQGLAGDATVFDSALRGSLGRDPAYVNLVADEIADRLDDLQPTTFLRLSDEVRSRPGRWRSALRPVVASMPPSARAAQMLDEIGTKEDVALIRRFVRASGSRIANKRLGLDLARRVAPRAFVEDMGRVRIEMAGQYLEGLDARRKVLELVCFLLTRPGMSATRDEVADAIWPEADQASALNSLNQTLYFLRRVLEPNYSDDLTPSYVHHESDLVWLDSTLVSSRSRRLMTQLDDADDMRSGGDFVLAAEYTARFALDFSYEDWASAYRDTLHAAYLQTMEMAIRRRIERKMNVEAVRLARRVLEIDSTAEQIERLLIGAYHQLGARAAVREQYAHYAKLMRDELGVDPPSLAELLEYEPFE